jgi:hypothetical protein
LIEFSAINCFVIDAVGGSVGYYHFVVCAIINIVAVFCYLSVWLGLRTKKSIREQNKRIFTSLAVIMASIFIGWFSMATARVILLSNGVSPIGLFRMKLTGASTINTVTTLNPFILFCFR